MLTNSFSISVVCGIEPLENLALDMTYTYAEWSKPDIIDLNAISALSKCTVA